MSTVCNEEESVHSCAYMSFLYGTSKSLQFLEIDFQSIFGFTNEIIANHKTIAKIGIQLNATYHSRT